MAVEAYGHQHHRDVIEASGLSPRSIPVDDDGAVIDQICDAAAVLLTPSHQFPLGMPLAPHRRAQAGRWAARAGAVVIEDDYDGEFRSDRRAVGAMPALAPEHVIYAGPASKTPAPAVPLARPRGSWVGPPRRRRLSPPRSPACAPPSSPAEVSGTPPDAAPPSHGAARLRETLARRSAAPRNPHD